jgi:hypothetical protein
MADETSQIKARSACRSELLRNSCRQMIVHGLSKATSIQSTSFRAAGVGVPSLSRVLRTPESAALETMVCQFATLNLSPDLMSRCNAQTLMTRR